MEREMWEMGDGIYLAYLPDGRWEIGKSHGISQAGDGRWKKSFKKKDISTRKGGRQNAYMS